MAKEMTFSHARWRRLRFDVEVVGDCYDNVMIANIRYDHTVNGIHLHGFSSMNT
jgi:hypothetical protein